MIPLRLYLYAAAVLAILGALAGYGHHQKAKGRAEVQAAWDAHQAQQVAAQATADRERAAEAFHQQRNVDRSRENDLKIQQAKAVADAGLRAERARLLAAVAARPADDHPAGPGGDAAPGAGADDAAAIARQLLGECSSRYAEVADEAGRLAGQVIGLQGFVHALFSAPPPASTTSPR